jgi:hypothetical protein
MSEEVKVIDEPLLTEDGDINPEAVDALSEAIEALAPTHIRLADDPEWSSSKDLWLFTHNIVGYFAQWAIRQSPYSVPDKLEEVLEQVHLVFKPFESKNGMFCMSLCEINRLLHEYILPLPQTMAWNEPKNGSTESIQFSSRYTKRDPDDEFIDLHALAHNVCVSIRNERRESYLFDVEFEKKYKDSLS